MSKKKARKHGPCPIYTRLVSRLEVSTVSDRGYLETLQYLHQETCDRCRERQETRVKEREAQQTNIARYSGPGRSGICICSHSWEDHHLGIVLRQEYIDETHEYYIPEECEFYGCNEMSGKDAEGNEHCWKYQDSLA